MKKWEKLPKEFRNEAVCPYYEVLKHRTGSLIVKHCFDFIMALVLLIVLSPLFLIISIWIACDSKGGVFFRQKRVTAYGRVFKIIKFRTMVSSSEQKGPQVTVSHDARVTKAGRFLRKCRLDELPQLLNVIKGDMSFVGTRPEVEKYVECYTPEMMATLLMPAGITSLASIQFKDEEKLLSDAQNADETYVSEVLPQKMAYNLEYIRRFNFFYDIRLMFMTVGAVLKK